MWLNNTPKNSNISEFFFPEPISDRGQISLGFIGNSRREMTKNGLVNWNEKTMADSVKHEV